MKITCLDCFAFLLSSRKRCAGLSAAKEDSTTRKMADMAARTAQTVSVGKQASGANTYSLFANGRLNSGNYTIVLEQEEPFISRTKQAVAE